MSTASQPSDETGDKFAFLSQFLTPNAKRAVVFMRAAQDANQFLDGSLVCTRANVRWFMRTHVPYQQAEAEWNETAAKIGGMTVYHRHKPADDAQKIAWRKAEFGDVDERGDFDLRYVFADYTVAEPSTFIVVEAHLSVTRESFDKLYATLEPAISPTDPHTPASE